MSGSLVPEAKACLDNPSVAVGAALAAPGTITRETRVARTAVSTIAARRISRLLPVNRTMCWPPSAPSPDYGPL